MVAEAVASNPDKFETGQTAQEWFNRRVKYQRVKNRTVRNNPLCPDVCRCRLMEPFRVPSLGLLVGVLSIPNLNQQPRNIRCLKT